MESISADLKNKFSIFSSNFQFETVVNSSKFWKPITENDGNDLLERQTLYNLDANNNNNNNFEMI